MRAKLTPVRVVRASALLVLAIVVFANSYGHFHTDIKPEVYVAPREMLLQYLSSWSSTPYLGAANFNVGLVPVLVCTTLLRAVGLSPELTFKVFHLVLWVLGASGAGRLLRELVPRVGHWSVLATGVAFLANPYTITGGSTLAIALPMCLLPWLLLCFLRALRSPSSWAWPAAAGLAFFAMSGMNVAVVPLFQLLMAIPLLLVVRHAWGLAWARVAKVVGKCALFVAGLSLYWLIPSVAAQGTGAQVVRGSETIEGIAKVSSFLEVLRGLGMWTLYGRSDAGPWLPQYAIYITVAIVVVVSALWPALSLLALRWTPPVLTRFAALSIALAAVIMVGLFPGDASSPAGWLMGWVFENVPGTVAFRTTNKIGAVLVLAFSLLLGYAVSRLGPLIRAVPGVASVAAGTAFALVLLWAAPAFTNNLYISEFDVPEYWQEAADTVNAGPETSRVLLLPGQIRPFYRWSQERPDDVTNSLLTRDAVIPETTSSTSAGGGNLLNALDDTLQTDAPYPNAVSTYARYLGVDQILLRHDTVWEDAGGARPAITSRVLARDPGLFGEKNFGGAGQNGMPPTIEPESFEEALLSPVQLYAVKEPEPTVRVQPVRGSLVVAGDAWSVPPLAREGLLEGTPLLRYASDLPEGVLASDLERVGRLVLTDTNRRRESVTNRLTAGNGPLLEASDEVTLGRALGAPDDQTVLRRSGIRVTATDEGAAFFDMPNAVPENAADGDPRSAWLFGDFRRAPGTTLEMELPTEHTLGEVTVDQNILGPVSIDEIEIEAGGRADTASFGGTSSATLDLGGVSADRVTLTVRSIEGDGFNLVGISEVDLGIDDTARRTARLPLSLDAAYGALTPQERQRFGEVPLDVHMTRVFGTTSLTDDAELDLRRDFTLPDDRSFRAKAWVRLLGGWEHTYDRLEGYRGADRYRSSGVFFNSASARASRAADGEDSTAWVPDSNMDGAWWEVRSDDPRTFETVRIEQRDGIDTDRDQTRFAQEVEISVDGTVVGRGAVGPGARTVTLDEPARGRTLRVSVVRTTAKAEETANARFTTIDAGPTMSTDGPPACVPVATVDGEPLMMRPGPDAGVALADSNGAPWVACDDLDLAWGEHELRPVDGIQVDSVALRDRQGLEDEPTVPAPTAQVEPGPGGQATVRAGASSSPYAVVLGQGYDSRWQATVDGEDIGPPVQLDGYSVGWIIDNPGEPHEVSIRFGPQRVATIAALLSSTVLLVAGYLIGSALLARRRRGREPRPEAQVGGRPPVATTTEEAADVLTPESVTDATPGHAPIAEQASSDRRSVLQWLLIVGVSFFAVGPPGLVASVLAWALTQLRGVRAVRLIDLGSTLVVVAAIVFVSGPGRTGGIVDADAIAASMWPHWLAGAGLVLAVIGALRRSHVATEKPLE